MLEVPRQCQFTAVVIHKPDHVPFVERRGTMLPLVPRPRGPRVPPSKRQESYIHANNQFAGRCITFYVLSFWDTNTEYGVCAGAMPYRRNFPATTGI